MATVGKGVLRQEGFAFFDALRSYNVDGAAALLTDDVEYQGPEGIIRGKEPVAAHFKSWLTDAKTRPSLTIKDVTGDGAQTHITMSVSGRFGNAPKQHAMSLLCLQGKIHHIVWK